MKCMWCGADSDLMPFCNQEHEDRWLELDPSYEPESEGA